MKLIVVVVSLNVVLATTALAQFQRPIKNGLVSNKSAGLGRAATPGVVERYSKLPLSFEANQGQTDSKVKFLSRCSGYSLFLTSNEAVLSLRQSRDHKGAITPATDETAVVRMKLIGANLGAAVTGLEELPGKINYFLGNDRKKWRTNVPTFAKIRYENVYSGINLVYYGNQRQLEYDFVVAPGADPQAIRFAIDGDEKLRIDGQGDMMIGAKEGEIRLHRPLIYQEINGSRQPIGGNFVIQGMRSNAPAKKSGRQVGFEVAQYDASKPLVIDPVLSYSTYIGGATEDLGYGIAVDSSGSAYVTGSTGPGFPTANAFQSAFGGGGRGLDAFVTKLNAEGSALLYSTYLGGAGDERGFGIAVDSSGNAFVTGFTTSVNFPTTANAFQAAAISGAFVVKLDATGSTLAYSTYLSGSDGATGQGIAVDSFGSAYVTGTTNSSNFPTVNALQPAYGGNYDAFVTKLNADGSALVYSTYLGGNSDDYGQGIAVDSAGNAYVTGGANSADFPTVNAFQAAYGGGQYDAFVTKLKADGSALVYSTYLGGSSDEGGLGIAVDSSGNAYVTGTTSSTDFPTANAFQAAYGGGGICGSTFYSFPCNDAFVTKLNYAGSALIYSTYLGGNNEDGGHGIAVDSFGNAYVTGTTSSSNFPTVGAVQPIYGGGEYDAFVTKLNAVGSALIYSTYLGGDDEDSAQGIAVDSLGNAYVTGSTGPGFPTANAFQATFGGSYDAFVTKFLAVTAVVPPFSDQ